MITREAVRKALVRALRPHLADVPDTRKCYPGQPKVDISVDKSLHVNVELVYVDGWAAELGDESNLRLVGTIVVEVVYKSGNAEEEKKANNILDRLLPVLSNSDKNPPLRTYASRYASPPGGPAQGLKREALITPFWYDTPR